MTDLCMSEISAQVLLNRTKYATRTATSELSLERTGVTVRESIISTFRLLSRRDYPILVLVVVL